MDRGLIPATKQIGNVTVREMAWPDFIKFLEMLSQKLSAMVNAQGEVKLNPLVIGQIVSSSAELSNQLLASSCRIGNERIDIESLEVTKAIDLLDAAVEINFSEEVLGRIKKLAMRLKGAFQK